MPKIKIFDGVNINYEYIKKDKNKNLKSGKDTKSAKDILVFIHPWACNLTVWDNEIKFLNKTGFSTLTYDLRGHGLSDIPVKNNLYSLLALTKELEDIINKLKLHKITLVAHSFGGMIAVKYCLRNKHKVNKVIFIDSIFSRPPNLSMLKKPILFLAKIIEAMNHNNIIKCNYSKKEFNFSKMHKKHFLCKSEGFIQTPFYTIIETAGLIYKTNMESALKKVKCPILVIQGDADTFVPLKRQRKIFSGMDNVQFVKVRHGKHDLVTEHSLAIAQIMLNSLRNKNTKV